AAVPHEGGKRFGPDSREYAILQAWIAAGRPLDVDVAPAVKRIDVTPRAQVLVEPDERVQLAVRATFADGSVRDVTALATFETSNAVTAVTGTGEAVRERFGEATILVRYLERRATVQLAFVPARPDFAWTNPPEANEVDRHVFAKLKTLRMLPS